MNFLRNPAKVAGSGLAFRRQDATLGCRIHGRVQMQKFFLSILAVLALTASAEAECQGKNLIDAMTASDQAALRARADAVPFAVGNYWQATRGDEVIHLIGTYHFDDPRHAATLATLSPVLASARTLLVEAGPAEEESLKQRISDDPSLLINTKGPTLPEIMAPEDWKRLTEATAARGIPGFMAAKFRPWYVTMLLSVPVCDLDQAVAANGLDKQLIQAANSQNIPTQALERYDTVFGIFDHMSQAEQIDLLTSALAVEAASADMATTLADSYFAQEGRLIWEFNRAQTLKMPGYTPERVDAEFAKMEKSMMINRNIAWIPVIESAAAKGPLLVAFGALHLSGQEGVLSLLQADGYTITRLPLP